MYYIIHMFKVGDIIQKNDSDILYTIIELKKEEGGNWDHGYYYYVVATIQSDCETESYILMHRFYGRMTTYYATLISDPVSSP
jgi:hypothetical protein